MKRKNLLTTLAILTAIGLLCSLAACSSGEKAAPTKPPAAQATQPPAKPPTSTPKPATPTPEEAKPTAKPAEPTATPVPPSPTPVAEAKPAMLVANPEDALDSYRTRIEMELVERPEGAEEPGLGDVFAMMFDDWVMEIEWVREPEARHTVSTHSGLIPDTESIEIGDTTWLKVGDDWIQTSSGLSGAEATAQQELQLDFEDLLRGLEGGMTPVGAETVDNIHCQKYTIDTDYAMAFPIPEDTSEEARQSMPSEMTFHVQGELWIADQRDLPPVVIRSQTTQELSFEIASQTITLVYREERHLYDINEPITIEPPEGAMAIPTVPSEPSVKEPTPQAEQPVGPAEVASLDDLDSYRLDWSVQVQMSADGGVTMNYTLEWVREPPSGHLVTGLGEYIWIDDTFWVKVGDTWMQGSQQGSQEEAENAFDQLGDIMEPDSDMVLAGEDTVNGVHCQHYVYDLGDTMHKEIWVADQSDLLPVVIRGMFRMETSQMVTEAEGNVYDINTPITIEPPK